MPRITEVCEPDAEALIDELEDEWAFVPIVAPPEAKEWTHSSIKNFFETDGVVVGQVKRRPLRVLCLHGGGSNNKVTEYQTQQLAAALGSKAQFSFLEGNREWDQTKIPQIFKSMFGEGPYYGWYGVDDDGDPNRPNFEKLQDPTVNYTYTAVELAMARVEAHITQEGPFDVLLGFSQGAIVATILTALILNRGEIPSWRHNMLFCGLPPRDHRYLQLTSEPLDWPATLVFGKADEYYQYGQQLRTIYQQPAVFEHEDGHKFPSGMQYNQQLAEHLLQQV